MATSVRCREDACMNHLRITSRRSVALLFGFALCSANLCFGQSAARIEGQATDASGRPLANAVVRLISDPTSHTNVRPWRYTLVGDSLGKYSQEGIAPGAYLVMLFTDGKGTAVSKNVLLKGGDRSVINLVLRPAMQMAGAIADRPGTGTRLRPAVQTR